MEEIRGMVAVKTREIEMAEVMGVVGELWCLVELDKVREGTVGFGIVVCMSERKRCKMSGEGGGGLRRARRRPQLREHGEVWWVCVRLMEGAGGCERWLPDFVGVKEERR